MLTSDRLKATIKRDLGFALADNILSSVRRYRELLEITGYTSRETASDALAAVVFVVGSLEFSNKIPAEFTEVTLKMARESMAEELHDLPPR